MLGRPAVIDNEAVADIIAGKRNDGAAIKIVESVACGATLNQIAEVNNIKYDHLYLWLKSSSERYKAFTSALEVRTTFYREMITGQLVNFSLADIRKLYDTEGRLLPPDQWPDDIAQAVASLDSTVGPDGETWTKKIKLNDKLKSIELLGRTLAMFQVESETKVVVSIEDLVLASYEHESRRGSEETRPGDTGLLELPDRPV